MSGVALPAWCRLVALGLIWLHQVGLRLVLIKTAGTMEGMDGMGGSSSMMSRAGSMVGGGAHMVVEGRGGVRQEGE